MLVWRMVARVAVAAVALFLFVVLPALPAEAHGAPTNPLSRSAACGPEGRHATGPACRAALASGQGRSVSAEWDNIRVADVRGRDRQVIPDGKLCSAGQAKFAGLDLPRADWPSTQLKPGAAMTFTYRGTIPHKGTFRLYVTKDGFEPTKPLTWSALEAEPFATATDPAFGNGSYAFQGRLPAGKSGRHLIYTIWQNTDTPDTYYSCADVDFGAAAVAAAPPAPPARPTTTTTTTTTTTRATASSPSPSPVVPTSTGQAVAVSRTASSSDQGGIPLAALIGGGVAAALVVVLVLRRRRQA
ncbi:lytic polysaccharide monooxygenase auxiliary activity family 9 protein [Saccharothrix deserti]|uniref:lytic polysaccharide monooxygenase auxiliary activity family 9 protein n=1 Tax=Saccharothrix deserti TaxID=2593674 RepID=UPI00192E350E|nr:lytic polysaccharide monooxygenase [Saccharothrix deserti]